MGLAMGQSRALWRRAAGALAEMKREDGAPGVLYIRGVKSSPPSASDARNREEQNRQPQVTQTANLEHQLKRLEDHESRGPLSNNFLEVRCICNFIWLAVSSFSFGLCTGSLLPTHQSGISRSLDLYTLQFLELANAQSNISTLHYNHRHQHVLIIIPNRTRRRCYRRHRQARSCPTSPEAPCRPRNCPFKGTSPIFPRGHSRNQGYGQFCISATNHRSSHFGSQ